MKVEFGIPLSVEVIVVLLALSLIPLVRGDCRGVWFGCIPLVRGDCWSVGFEPCPSSDR